LLNIRLRKSAKDIPLQENEFGKELDV